MKKVLIFSLNYYPRFIGGAEVAIKEITDRVTPEDIEFHMVALQFDSNLPKMEKIGNVTVHRIGFARAGATIADLRKFPLHLNKHLYQLLAAQKAEELHKKYSFDAIWAMMAHSCAIPAGIFKSNHPETPYLLTLQEGDPPEYIEKMMKPVWGLFKAGFTKADYLQAISTFLLSWGKRMGFAGAGVVIPNAVDVARFSKPVDDAARAALRKKYASESDTLMITTSRLVHKNAVDDVINALAYLPESVKFLILGIGPDEDVLRALAKEKGVDARIFFLGQVGHAELPLYLKASDIFIRPSRSEGMGNSFVEAMAARVPVIATQEGGISDFLFDEKRNPGTPPTGYAVDKDSPKQIAEAVADIMENKEKVARILDTAEHLVKEKYDWETVTKDMRSLFEKMFSS